MIEDWWNAHRLGFVIGGVLSAVLVLLIAIPGTRRATWRAIRWINGGNKAGR